MERKIGETFEFEGKKLQVKERASSDCDGCFFDEQHIPCSKNVAGYCGVEFRADKKKVIFVEAMEQEMEERTIKLTLEKAKEFYKKGGEFRELALSAFTEEELTKVELPKTWEEFCSQFNIHREYYIETDSNIYEDNNNGRSPLFDKNMLPSKEAAEAHLALMQLHQLRDCYRQGWNPSYLYDEKKYNINNDAGLLEIRCSNIRVSFLSFQTREIAEQFLNNFKELIIQAGDLI